MGYSFITISIGALPSGIAINSAGTRVYVTNISSGNISVIDAASNQEIATIPVGGNPFDIVLNNPDTLAYVANAQSGNISIIDMITQ